MLIGYHQAIKIEHTEHYLGPKNIIRLDMYIDQNWFRILPKGMAMLVQVAVDYNNIGSNGQRSMGIDKILK